MKTTNKFINLSVKGFLEINEKYTFPITDGNFGDIMITNGVGGVTWQPASSLSINSDNISEGITNLFFTNERVDDRVSLLIQNGTGLTWTYNDPSNTFTGNVSLSPFSTTNLSEGTNLYFTNERVDDRVSVLIQNGTGISWLYNDPANTLTPTISLSSFTTDNLAQGTTNKYLSNEAIDDRVSALIQNGTGLTWTYNDPSNTFTGNVSLSPFSTTNLAEGTNLYFTDERVDDRVAALIQDSATVTWTYNDGLNTLTATAAPSPISVQKAGTLISTRGTINLIDGSNITIGVVDDAFNDRTNITITNTPPPMNPGTLHGIYSDNVAVGDSDIEFLNFSDKFTVIESPDKYINLDISIMLDEVSDVSITSPIADGDLLIYNSGSGLWENQPPPDSIFQLTSPIPDGDILVYNSTAEAFVNVPDTDKLKWTWSASRNNNSSYIHLKGPDGTYTNVAPFVAAHNCVLKAISASTDGTEVWDAQIKVNDVVVVTLSLITVDSAYNNSLSININAGDKISFYCDGNNINKPKITGWFEEI